MGRDNTIVVPNIALSIIRSLNKLDACAHYLNTSQLRTYMYYRSSNDCDTLLDMCQEQHIPCAVLHTTASTQHQTAIPDTVLNSRFSVLLIQLDAQAVFSFNARSIIFYSLPDSVQQLVRILSDLNAEPGERHGLLVYETRDIEDGFQRIHNSVPDKASIHGIFNTLTAYSRQRPVTQRNPQVRILLKQILADIGDVYLSGLLHVLQEFHQQQIMKTISLTDQSLEYAMLRKTLRRFDFSNVEDMRQRRQEDVELLVEFLQTTACRRQFLIHKISGQEIAPCGICDNCQRQRIELTKNKYHPQLLTDIIQTILEVREKFGKTVLLNILRGRNDKTIRQYQLHRCTGYGRWHDIDAQNLRSALYQMMDDGLITIRQGLYPTLCVTEAGHRLVQDYPVKALTLPKQIDSQIQVDTALYDALRRVRTRMAEKHNVPTFVIVRDAVLQQICLQLPDTKEAFMALRGVGPGTWRLCGQELLKVVRQYRAAVKQPE